MDILMLKTFLMWCSIINAGSLILMTLMVAVGGDWIYSMHSKFHTISRDAFNVAMYAFIGFFKILFVVFNLVPYIALIIISS